MMASKLGVLQQGRHLGPHLNTDVPVHHACPLFTPLDPSEQTGAARLVLICACHRQRWLTASTCLP